MSGQQHYGWNGGQGGRGGFGFGGVFDTAYYGGQGGYYGQGGHGGFAGGGGGGGGGRRPWRGGDGPMGHRYEDPRRDGRVQKNTGGGGGRGRGRGRGRGGIGRGGRGRGGRGRGGQEATQGQGAANRLHTWTSDKKFEIKETGEREEPEGVNFDALMNMSGHENSPAITDGNCAVEGYQRKRLNESQATQFVGADVSAGRFVGVNLEGRNTQSLLGRAQLTRPQGTRWDMTLQAVAPEVATASTELVRGRFLGALVTNEDPFSLFPEHDREVVMEDAEETTPNDTMRAQHEEEGAEDTNLEDAAARTRRRAKHAKDL